MNNMINLTAYLPENMEFAKKVRRRERWEKLSAFAESLATLIIAASAFVLAAAFLIAL